MNRSQFIHRDFRCYHCQAEHHELCVGVPCLCPCVSPQETLDAHALLDDLHAAALLIRSLDADGPRQPRTMQQHQATFYYCDDDGRVWELVPTGDPHLPFTISLMEVS